jgi:hypothetical protein
MKKERSTRGEISDSTIPNYYRATKLAVNPLKYFITDAWSKDSVESDKTLKDIFYEAYKRFCNGHKLAIESNENFGRILKNKFSFQDGRETSGERSYLLILKICQSCYEQSSDDSY